MNAASVMLNDSMRRLPLPSGEDICTTWWSFLSEYQSSNWAQAGKTWVAHKGSEGPPSLHPSFLPFFLPLSMHIALPKCMSSFVPPPDTHFRFLHFSSQQPSFTCTSHQPKWEPEQTLPERCAVVEGARETSTTAYANRPSLVSLPLLQHLYTCSFITHFMPFCGSQETAD